MTADEYVERIRTLCQGGRYAEALSLSDERGHGYWDVITPEQMRILELYLHRAQLVADAGSTPERTAMAASSRPR